MAQEVYGEIKIIVRADEEKINTDECALSDEFDNIVDQLEEWLKHKSANLTFVVEAD
jgi:hypothetical protein